MLYYYLCKTFGMQSFDIKLSLQHNHRNQVRYLFFFIAVLLFSTNSNGRNRIVSQLVDKNNQPIIGAVVVEEGTKNYAISDNNGNFEISVSNTVSNVNISIFGFDKITFPSYQISPIIEMKRSDKYPLFNHIISLKN
jgi:hypothetical protein